MFSLGGNTATGLGSNQTMQLPFGSNTGPNTGPTQSGGLFGNNLGPGASGPGANAAGQSGGLFGQKPSGGGLFGNSLNQNQSQPSGGLFGQRSASTGGLFGGQNNNNNNNNSTGGGLFGSNSSTQPGGPSGGLFGSNSSTQPQSQGQSQPQSGGLFGANTSQSQPPPQSQSGGLFGNTSQSQGQSQGQPQGQPQGQSTSLFGNTNPSQSQPSSQGNSLFSNPTINNNTQPQPQPQLQPHQNLGILNNPPSNTNQLLFSDKDKSVYTPSMNDQLLKIKDQWDPNSGNCKLKTHFYNKLNENDLQILLNQPRPMNESPDDWNKAMSERPNNQYYPIKITSFSDVSNRIETQLDHVKKSRYLLNLINENQSKLSSKHDLENSIRIKNCKTKHVKLSRRLLKLATTLAILKLRGYPLLPEEEEISKQFELLNSKLNDPNNSLSKLNDLFARLTILKQKSDALNYQFNNSINLMNDNLMNDNLMNDNDNLINGSNANSSGDAGTGANGTVDGTVDAGATPGASTNPNTTTNTNDHSNPNHPDNHDDSDLNQSNHEEFVIKISKLLLKQQKGLNYVNEILQKDLDTTNKLTN